MKVPLLFGLVLLAGCGGEASQVTPERRPLGEPEPRRESVVAEEAPRASERVQKAEAEMAKGNFESAKGILEAAIKEHIDDARAHFDMGIVQEELGNLKAAELAYQLAIKADSQFAHALINLGLLYYQQDREQDAKKQLELALALFPDSMEGHFNLSMVLASLGDVDAAIRHAERASELAPADGQVWLKLALYRLGAGDEGGAKEAIEKARTHAQPGDILLQAELGALLRQLGFAAYAVEALGKALEDDHLSPRVQAALLTEKALALKGIGEASKARESVEAAIRTAPQYPLAHYVLANMHASAKKWKLAEQHYKKFLELAPADPNAKAAREKLAKVKQLKKK